MKRITKEKRWAAVTSAGAEAHSGFTLLEIVIAMALFSVAMAVAAQSLASYYVTMDMQQQRIVAANHCRTVLDQMRSVRNATPNAASNTATLVDAILAKFPAGVAAAGPASLRNAKVTVSYEDTNANPLVATVTVAWNDLRGRAMHLSATSALSDQEEAGPWLSLIGTKNNTVSRSLSYPCRWPF